MISIQRFDGAAEFRSSVEGYLLLQEAEHNLLLGLISTLETAPDFYGPRPYLACGLDDGDVVAVAVMTPSRGLVVSFCLSDAAIRLLASDAHDFQADIPGVMGPFEVSARFADAWRDLSGQSYRVNMAERIYRLERVVQPAGISGAPRRAGETDIDVLTRWRVAFAAEAIPDEVETPEEARAAALRGLALPPEQRGMFLWEAGRPVSLVGYGGPTPNSMRIGPVYTPPESRRRGYASACTAAVCQYLLDHGRKFCTLFTDLANPTSNHIYQQIGFEPVCDVHQYRFGPPPGS